MHRLNRSIRMAVSAFADNAVTYEDPRGNLRGGCTDRHPPVLGLGQGRPQPGGEPQPHPAQQQQGADQRRNKRRGEVAAAIGLDVCMILRMPLPAEAHSMRRSGSDVKVAEV